MNPDATLPARSAQTIARLRTHWTGTWRGGLLLALICITLHLPGQFTLPVVDRDESRFAEATRRMVVSDSWRGYVVPTVENRQRLNKPPLIYWLQAGALRLTGQAHAADNVDPISRDAVLNDPNAWRSIRGGIWAYRMPSLLGALIAALATWRLGSRMFNRPTGWLAGLLLGTCVVVMVDARQARADQVLLLLTTLAQWALWEVYRARRPNSPSRRPWLLQFWIATGFAILVKGPVTPGVAVLTLIGIWLLTGQWRWCLRLRPVVGLAVVSAMVAPWVLLVIRDVGWSTVIRTTVDEVLGRATSAQEGHWGPPGYYLVLLPLLLWPGSLALVPGLLRAVRWATPPAQSSSNAPGWMRRLKRRPGRPAELFCIAWIVPAWIVFELTATKLPHYTLPTYPALALLCARGLLSARTDMLRVWRQRSVRIALWGWIVLGQAVAVVGPALLLWWARHWLSPAIIIAAIAAIAVAQALIIAIAWQNSCNRVGRVQILAVICAAAAYLTALELLLPRGRALWLSPRMVTETLRVDPTLSRPLAAVGYDEISFIFLTRNHARFLHWREAQEWLTDHPDGLLWMADRPDIILDRVVVVALVEGFNYSTGDRVRLQLLESSNAGQSGP
jgi:4-amino-4-deoxy-L-arabinose transferase-like glycosyltransferase